MRSRDGCPGGAAHRPAGATRLWTRGRPVRDEAQGGRCCARFLRWPGRETPIAIAGSSVADLVNYRPRVPFPLTGEGKGTGRARPPPAVANVSAGLRSMQSSSARPEAHHRSFHVRSYKSVAVGYTLQPSIRFFPLHFPEGTENGELHNPTEAGRGGHSVWRHSVHLGPWRRPVFALAGDGLADERGCVLADCLLFDFGCSSGLVSNFFVKRQNCTHLGMANTHVDVAVFPALANCTRDTAIVGSRIQGWTCLRRQRMGSTAFGQGVAPHGSRGRQDCSQRSRDGYRQCRRAAVSLFRALHF